MGSSSQNCATMSRIVLREEQNQNQQMDHVFSRDVARQKLTVLMTCASIFSLLALLAPTSDLCCSVECGESYQVP